MIQHVEKLFAIRETLSQASSAKKVSFIFLITERGLLYITDSNDPGSPVVTYPPATQPTYKPTPKPTYAPKPTTPWSGEFPKGMFLF